MIALIFTGLIYTVLGYLLLSSIIPRKNKTTKKRKGIYILLILGLVIRYLGAFLYKGHPTDIDCFSAWADMMFYEGPSGFYASDAFTDYPPLYMYVLWLLGAVKNILPLSDLGVSVLIKTPAIVCDILTAVLLYRLADKNIGKKAAYGASVLWLFNPAVFLNSAIWGQVDSVLTLLVFAVLYLVTEKKLIPSYFVFALAIILKPQALFYAPVLLFALIEETIYPEFRIKVLIKHIGYGLLALLTAVIVCIPFGLENVINQYISTLSSYQFYSVNAYNLWSALGLNWEALTPSATFISSLMIVLVVVFSAVFFFNIKSNARYFWMSGFICLGVFILSAKMHERYAFPAMLLFLAGFLLDRNNKRAFWTYLAVSSLQLINCGYVLFYTSSGENLTNSQLQAAVVMGIVALAVFIFMIYTTVKMCSFKKTDNNFAGITDRKINRTDLKIILILTAVYAVIALFNLGNLSAPKSGVMLDNESQSFAVSANNGVKDIKIYLGEYNLNENNTLTVGIYGKNGENLLETELDDGSVFCWNEYTFESTKEVSSVTFSAKGRVNILEVSFTDTDGQKVGGEGVIFDEQELAPERRTYKNSTYFDEIYHARTAYEFLEGKDVYEWTHPPLGKAIIAIGVKVFGMTPFGWRIMGTLFGILMVPVMYIFAKKLFGNTFFATFAAVLFTFDFMHFVQTRIATIDVYITFFIMLMYLFMSMYLSEDFYSQRRKKLFIPLALSGVAFGLGVASKWTGVYAGAGLAVLFFANIAVNYSHAKESNLTVAFWKRTKELILWCVIFFVIVPLAIYILSYIPFINANKTGISGIWENQIDMFSYHSGLHETHAYASSWYEWAAMVRPVWYYSGTVSETVGEGISAFGNPLVWWIGIPAFLYIAYLAFTKKDRTALFLTIGYLAQILPWVFVTRVTFIYHYFPSVPFVVLMIAYSAIKLLGDIKSGKKILIIYLIAAVVLFAMFYPVLSGYPVSIDYVTRFLKWSSEWVLVRGS